MMRIRPDGFTGALMAVEGISDARAILHGPGGCRICHMILSRKSFPRLEVRGMSDYNIPYFFGQPRLPCTYVEETNYINGAYELVVDALPYVKSRGDNMITIINSPGAALIGDDHDKAIAEAGITDKAFYIEESLVSVPLSQGYDHTMASVIEWLSPKRKEELSNSVNILGMSTLDKDWNNSVREIKKSIELMGLEPICVPGAGCSVSDLKRSVNASFNIVVSPEFGLETAKFYEKEYNIPYIMSPSGAPVGFDSTETWIKAISKMTSADPTRALERIKRYKKGVFNSLMGSRFKTIKMRGSSFSICGEASIIYPLTKWLYDYLSIVPVGVVADPGSYQPCVDALKDFLSSIGRSSAWGKEPGEWSDFVFSDGNSSALAERAGHCGKGVDIGLPTIEYLSMIPRPIYGAKGAMYLLDEIMKD